MPTQVQLEKYLDRAVQKHGSGSHVAEMLREQLRVLKEAPSSAYETFISGVGPSGKHSGTDTEEK